VPGFLLDPDATLDPGGSDEPMGWLEDGAD
jgi:hypothetical protein